MRITRNAQLTFEVDNSFELFEYLLEEYSDFDKNHLNPRYAMNCALKSWHLSEWTYHEFYRDDENFQDIKKKDKNGDIKKISGLLQYQQFLTKLCPELEYMRLISNGIKHCVLNDKSRNEKTIVHEGDFSAGFSRHDYDVTRFVIVNNKHEQIDFEDTLLETIEFWRARLSKDMSKDKE